jgi:DNA-binding IclR family transcriptional regulator
MSSNVRNFFDVARRVIVQTMPTHDDWNRVKTVETTFAIIQTIEELEGATMAEIVERNGIAKSTAYRHLKTLLDLGYIVNEESSYYLSLEFLRQGVEARDQRVAFEHVKSIVDDLAELTEDQAQFLVEEHNHGRFVYFQRGERAVQTGTFIGRTAPLHRGASGKALLAAMPDERVHEIIDDVGLSPATEHTITDEEELWDEIEEIRESGYALNDREYIDGLRGVGVAVMRPDGGVYGSISVSGAANRLSGARFTEEIPEALLGMANELEINLAYV